LHVAAAMMVVPDRYWPVTIPIRVGVGHLFRSQMDMSRMVVVIRLDQRDSGPVRCVPEVVLELRHAMQVQGRQEGDA
jgi:hypothetical protein